MKLTVTTFLSLDGTMQAPGGAEEDPSDGFDQGGWMAPLFDEEVGAAITRWFSQADAFLLGRRTYDIFAGYWPQVTDPDPVAQALNTLPKHVASRTLSDPLPWAGAQVLQGDVASAVRELKGQDGRELQVHGSGALVQTLLAEGLVDELRLMTFPVLVGSGRRLFAEGTRPARLELLGSHTTSAGTVIAEYGTGGALRRGTFGVVDGRDELVDDGSAAAG
ncbi:MAG: Dihydrofolate reductase [uncultured Solirubrobacteraceae bacterium]|uniref:Dihydrofolate reductase n=1 Tax=uncultured Solirubrobacteraceae bacterium TaxID=1162706 RepID=A0A6J4TEE8_9ACTN|nr:MAG: Dihydrofolate reductase [uncultured Solirubrobacteraceae bacterium]